MTRLYFLWYNEVKTFFSIKKLLYKKFILNGFKAGLSPHLVIFIVEGLGGLPLFYFLYIVYYE
ncbi:hypothetical protein ESA2_CDS15 [Staphylococcus phage ESa2]|nr:hypothetical protein ESA2_CDS15 [Staphylococcus phage ESa2]